MSALAIEALAKKYPGFRLEQLVEELAAGIRAPADIWADYGVTSRVEAAMVLRIPVVMQMITEAKARWNGVNSTRERIKLKALAGIETGMISLYQGVTDNKIPLNHRVEGFKFLGKLAGIDAETRAGEGAFAGGGVSIRIDLSDSVGGARHVVSVQSPGYTIDADAEDVEMEDDEGSDEAESEVETLEAPDERMAHAIAAAAKHLRGMNDVRQGDFISQLAPMGDDEDHGGRNFRSTSRRFDPEADVDAVFDGGLGSKKLEKAERAAARREVAAAEDAMRRIDRAASPVVGGPWLEDGEVESDTVPEDFSEFLETFERIDVKKVAAEDLEYDLDG